MDLARRRLCAGVDATGEVTGAGSAPAVDEAKAQFESIWRRWLAWAKLREDT